MRAPRLLPALLALCCILQSTFLATAEADPSTSIRSVLDAQVAAWNRGDIPAFMQGYKDSPDTTFVGRTVEHGYRSILERYKRQFADRAAMGTLSFTNLNIRLLDAQYALVTGNFHLDRTSGAGGPASGIFSLVFERTPQGWRIILDHSS